MVDTRPSASTSRSAAADDLKRPDALRQRNSTAPTDTLAAWLGREEWLRLLLTVTRGGLWGVDIASHQLTWSPEMYAIFGRDPALGPMAYEEFKATGVHSADCELVDSALRQLLIENKPDQASEIEHRIKRADGAIRWVSTTMHVDRDEQGRAIRALGITRDITARKQAEQLQLENEQLLRKITELTPDIVTVFNDHTREIIYSNRSFARMLGYDSADDTSVAARLARTMHPDDFARLPAYRLETQALADNDAAQFECRFQHADGTWRWVQTRTTVFARDANGRVCQTLRTLTDITERRRAEEQLRQLNAELEERVAARTSELINANRELEAANRELEAFAYSVSHDLRGPLRAIDGFSRVVLDDFATQLSPEANAYLRRVRNGAQRMAELIEALLALSHTTRSELTIEPVDLSALAQVIVAELQRTEPNREIEIELAVDVKATGDARLLRIALENLLGNAWKFTAGRHPARIELGVREIAGECVYFVRDNGAGFDATSAAGKLFVPFQRFHKANEFSGTGVGLATVQRIIARHGGRIWVESAPGAGTTFFFTLACANIPA